MTTLLDASVWIEYLSGRGRAASGELEARLDENDVVVCGPVLAELLAGTAATDRDELWRTLGALPWADLDRAAWRRAGELAHDLGRAGERVALTDVAIAVAAVDAGAAVWTRDSDFRRIRRVLPELELYRSR